MNLHLEQKESIYDKQSISACTCDHCDAIREQQKESEMKWVRQPQLYDR